MEAPAFEPHDQPKWTRLPIRTRPHRNPLAENEDEHPLYPQEVVARLPEMYPGAKADKRIEFADIGCAFGGMLFSIAPMFPDTMMVGLEIRSKVIDFARSKALEMRTNANPEAGHHHFNNVWFEQLNVMKYGSNYFEKGQLSKLFFCYPDPHWKKKNIRRRIISPTLVHEYAYWLRVGGLLYTVTDVEDLENWMIACLDGCPLFRRLTDEELDNIPNHPQLLELVRSSSEDAQRTQRKGFKKNFAVHIRVEPHNRV